MGKRLLFKTHQDTSSNISQKHINSTVSDTKCNGSLSKVIGNLFYTSDSLESCPCLNNVQAWESLRRQVSNNARPIHSSPSPSPS